jgi:hypothetical protein
MSGFPRGEAEDAITREARQPWQQTSNSSCKMPMDWCGKEVSGKIFCIMLLRTKLYVKWTKISSHCYFSSSFSL